MNFNKFINSDYLKENPLCGIDTYKDELNLTTGACTRQIKKLVLTGEENTWAQSGATSNTFYFNVSGYLRQRINITICSHYTSQANINGAAEIQDGNVSFYANVGLPWEYFYIRDSNFATVANLKSYLQQQYAAGTPVTVWYVLATPTTEIITVPSGLSGTVEGYLNQSGTPTPTNPIYPTANTVEKWFDINHYIMGTSTDTITTLPADIYANATTATVGLKGNTLQSSIPSPTSPVMPQGTGERTANLFDMSTVENGKGIAVDGSISNYVRRCSTVTPIDVSTHSNVTLSFTATLSRTRVIYALFNDNTLVTRQTAVFSGTIIDVSSGNKLYICFYDTNDTETVQKSDLSNVMLNTGSTALPYEPYGYFIEIEVS